MKNGTEKYIETVNYLGKLYDHCNANLFGCELMKPVITVQQDARNKTNGWWSVKKVWKENDKDEGEYELNITAQALNRPIYDLAATMIHEMCHQYASVRNIQDTSRSGSYHNKLYKRIAEAHCLSVECIKTSGWSHTELTDDGKKFIDNFLAEYPEFKVIYRLPIMKGISVRNTSTRKYICPVCGNSVRATKEVNILCIDCNQPMQEE